MLHRATCWRPTNAAANSFFLLAPNYSTYEGQMKIVLDLCWLLSDCRCAFSDKAFSLMPTKLWRTCKHIVIVSFLHQEGTNFKRPPNKCSVSSGCVDPFHSVSEETRLNPRNRFLFKYIGYFISTMGAQSHTLKLIQILS